MSLSRNELQDLLLAGRIAYLTLDRIIPRVKAGVSIASLYDSIVNLITKTKCADLAFPPNISIDECAAHDTAAPNEKRIIPKKGLVKIDLGANVNGMLSDVARTISIDGKHSRLIKAAEQALENAIDIIRPGIRVTEIGATVQDTIESYGYKPIANLTGHAMKKGHLHAGLSIPSVKSLGVVRRGKLKPGMIVAIEPFSTNGTAGYIEDASKPPLIYSLQEQAQSQIGQLLINRFGKLPFSLRSATLYLQSKNKKTTNLAKILDQDRFHGYRPLVEKSGGLVAQAEHTVLVTKKSARIITKS
ncbi:MAG: type II methionyl aminopeptidase [Candidatus Hodarchaeota archaeon]